MRLLAFTRIVSLISAIDNGFTRPPLGWSALYGAPFSTVNEAIVQAAGQGLVTGGFAAAGYTFVVLDDWVGTQRERKRKAARAAGRGWTWFA